VSEIEYRRRPCSRCPWRQDSDLSAFSDADFRKLEAANGSASAEAPLTAPMMSCHLDQPGTSRPMRLCAGWLATVGPDHLGVRLHLIAERLRPDCLQTAADWPALHATLDDMNRQRRQPDRGDTPHLPSRRTGHGHPDPGLTGTAPRLESCSGSSADQVVHR
jgi:hypothetical protein